MIRISAPVLVGFREPRVVAVQTAPHVARRERPVAIEQLPTDQLHGIVVANRLGIGNSGNRLGRAVVPGVADHVCRDAIRIDRSDVLDGLVELFVNEPRRDRNMRRQLVLDSERQLLHPHWLEIRVDVLERGLDLHAAPAPGHRDTPEDNRGC